MAKKKKGHSFIKAFLVGIILIAAIIGFKGYKMYQSINEPNLNLNGEKSVYIYIPTGANYLDVVNILYQNNYIINRSSFEWVAEKKNYPNNVKAGKYKLTANMGNNAIINLLRSGKQTPVKLVFNKIRTKDKFAGIIGRQIEADSVELLKLISNSSFLAKYNKEKETALCLFIPNTYEFFWNTSAKDFIERMNSEYDRFWTKKRIEKAKALNFSRNEVYILASIVEEETTKNDEKSRLAGVYYNRLKKGMRLQADPTVKYALGNFEIKRVLNKHLEYDSKYNTYRYAGLPPGPICIPSIATIDAVLDLEYHSYLYFCAKDDFSGYHAYAKTLEQHNQNAEKYRKALNKKRIYK